MLWSTRYNSGSDLHPQLVAPALLPVYPQTLLFPLSALQLLVCSLLMGFGHQLRHKGAVTNLWVLWVSFAECGSLAHPHCKSLRQQWKACSQLQQTHVQSLMPFNVVTLRVCCCN